MFFLLVLLPKDPANAQQYFTIPDPAFRDYLDKNYPYLLNNQKQLIIASANSFAGTISCMGMGIRDLSGLEYFTNLLQINCSKNTLEKLPSLNALKGLTHLWAEECGLTELPEISHLKNLQVFDVKSNNLSVLPNLSGLTSLTYFDCSINKIVLMPDLSGLVNLESFYCYRNRIEAISSVLNSPNLKIFDCSFNNLKSVPDLSRSTNLIEINLAMNFISELPSFVNLINLERLYLYNNSLTMLPVLPPGDKLMLLNAASNKLISIPDLSTKTSLTVAAFDHNHISFSDIIPQVAHPSFASVFIFNPQDTINDFTNVSAIVGDEVGISVKRDAQINSSRYFWKKDGSFFDTTTSNSVLLKSIKKSQEGSYIAEVVNSTPGLESLRLIFKTVSLKVSECGASSTTYNYSIVSNSCREGAVISIENLNSSALNGPFKYQLVTKGVKSLWYTTTQIDELKPGVYDLIIKDKNSCLTELKNYILIPNAEDCDNVITPNGDGMGDYYSILASGKIKIYDKSLKLIKELIGPGIWDGTDSRGEIVPIGLYIIVINDKDKINILVLN
ncbi:leucine-rich repeat-containing protein [Sporocytophaga myxococcoides]|uniref:Leucine-rich repeat-containing protein n=1 Tax=Sporocytophaga myxococcoides TaxID=153721 RepID=A0A098LCZ1_9BACT|nr:leucine-rich repeat-containing protein [Sporocytophaga myxococcoides]